MSNDLFLVFGSIVALLAIPSVISAFSSNRPPRAGIVLVVVGAAMIAWANINQPSGYSFEEIPNVFVRVLAGIIR